MSPTSGPDHPPTSPRSSVDPGLGSAKARVPPKGAGSTGPHFQHPSECCTRSLRRRGPAVWTPPHPDHPARRRTRPLLQRARPCRHHPDLGYRHLHAGRRNHPHRPALKRPTTVTDHQSRVATMAAIRPGWWGSIGVQGHVGGTGARSPPVRVPSCTINLRPPRRRCCRRGSCPRMSGS